MLQALVLTFALIHCGGSVDFNIVSFYDTPSSDDFDRFLTDNELKSAYSGFSRSIRASMTTDHLDPSHFLRQGTDWRKLEMPAFAMPPREKWRNIRPVIRLIENEIIPAIGPVEILSGYRSAEYNSRADGAPGSRHLKFQALDLVPANLIARKQLHAILLDLWKREGRRYGLGLGLYSGHRFHLDTAGYRRW
ncbi:MAG: D-Ala-D-Ala carboxypeptidase family metallohydrolase [bacterium]|nr:D-Ala-D-Ala carboxypeptidase family metallohydrolase [bacterium]